MSTGIYRTSTSYQVERRNWLLGLHGTDSGSNPSATLDVSAFTAGTHYPNGYIPSGTVVSRLASNLWGPFDAAAASGDHGITFGSVTVDTANTAQDFATGLVQHGNIDFNKLPTGGRPTQAALETALPLLNVTVITP